MIEGEKDKKNTKKIIVMIPAYNEEKSIGKVIKSIPRKINSCRVEVLVLNDNSSDKTREIAEKSGADYVFNNKVNKGLGYLFRKGIDKALELKADIIVNIDGDGQFDSKDIKKLSLPVINNEADMVSGSRFVDNTKIKNMPWIKKFGNKIYSKIISNLTDEKFSDVSCGFRAYSREAALKLNLFGNFTYTQEVFLDLVEKGMRIKEIPVKVRYFNERKSRVAGKLVRYGLRTLGIITRASRDNQPLSFFGIPGFIILILGVAGGLFSFVFWLVYHVTSPIKTLFSVSVFFMIFGFSLIMLALIADMLKRNRIIQEQTLYLLKKGGK